MTIALSPDQNRRAHAIFRACDAALIRLNQASYGTGLPIFGPLGESLTWLCALNDLLDAADPTYRVRRDSDPDGAVIPGLRWARHQVLHGVAVVEMGGMIPGTQLGLMPLGLSQLGSVNTHYWSGRLALPSSGRSEPELERSYDKHIGGKVLQRPLTAARAFLIAEAGLPDPFANSGP